MKTIENKITTIPQGGDVFANYGTLLTILLNKPPHKGMDLNSMRRDIRLLELFETNTSTFEVSPEDLQYLSQLAETSEWAIRHRDILDFADYITSLID